MSKGNVIVPIRIPPTELAAIDEQIKRSLGKRKAGDYNRTSWIIQAIREKLNHLARSNPKDVSHDPVSPIASPVQDAPTEQESGQTESIMDVPEKTPAVGLEARVEAAWQASTLPVPNQNS